VIRLFLKSRILKLVKAFTLVIIQRFRVFGVNAHFELLNPVAARRCTGTSNDKQPNNMATSSADSNPLSIGATIDSISITRTRLGSKVYCTESSTAASSGKDRGNYRGTGGG